MRSRLFLTAALAAFATGGVIVASSFGQGAAQGPASNGGARQWVAFDPLVSVAPVHQSLNTVRVVRLANTTNAANSFTVTFERSGRPALAICSGSLPPGETRTCGNVNRASSGFVDGYILVRASQPLLAGGHIDLPVQDYEQQGSSSAPRLKFLGRGTLQRFQYEFQQGCPPRAGNGCPTGQSTLSPG